MSSLLDSDRVRCALFGILKDEHLYQTTFVSHFLPVVGIPKDNNSLHHRSMVSRPSMDVGKLAFIVRNTLLSWGDGVVVIVTLAEGRNPW